MRNINLTFILFIALNFTCIHSAQSQNSPLNDRELEAYRIKISAGEKNAESLKRVFEIEVSDSTLAMTQMEKIASIVGNSGSVFMRGKLLTIIMKDSITKPDLSKIKIALLDKRVTILAKHHYYFVEEN